MNGDDMDPLARMDQAMAGVKDLARLCWALHKDCVGQGFTEAQALRLTAAWLRAVTESTPSE